MLRAALVALLVVVSGALAACEDDSSPNSAGDNATSAPAEGESDAAVPVLQTEEGLSTIEIAERLTRSIVRVQTESATVDQFGRVRPGSGVGSGVVIDTEGHIVTNNHVITGNDGEPADSIEVVLFDQTTLPATVVGRDEATDLAVLQIDRDDLDAATWGDPSGLRVGQDVVAIGYALGLEGAPSVTRGVLSATNRTITEPPYTIPDALQTDSGINPGNSGGPLVNARGEVIGINTAIISNAQNIGFAISVGLAAPIVEQLIAEGSVSRAYVGIASADVTATIARNFDLPVERGIYLTVVADGSPAEDAGLEPNDVVVEVDGEAIRNNGELLAILAERQPGDTVTFTYYRGGDEREAELTLAERPDEN